MSDRICCADEAGCDYSSTISTEAGLQNEENNLCAPGRNPSVPLCGACLPGLSEVYNHLDVKCVRIIGNG